MAGSLSLARGWQTFSRARGLSRRCTLHFTFDGDATLYVRVFGEDGRRAGCCLEGDDRCWEPSSSDDGGSSARAAGGARSSSSFSGSSSGGDSSSGGRDQPPRRRALVRRERESARAPKPARAFLAGRCEASRAGFFLPFPFSLCNKDNGVEPRGGVFGLSLLIIVLLSLPFLPAMCPSVDSSRPRP